MLVPGCLRECAPERGGARRRCLPFLASFGLSKFWSAPALNDGWKLPSARAAIYARRGAALGPRCTDCSTHVGRNFFLAVKPATRAEEGKTDAIAPRRSFLASERRLGPIRIPQFREEDAWRRRGVQLFRTLFR